MSETIAYGNGRVTETWFKQTLGKAMIDRALELASKDGELESLKELLFKSAECSYKPPEEKDWPGVELYT